MNLLKKAQFLIFFVLFTTVVNAYNLKQLSNKDGLSNSAILSICQDNERFMWFGSCDGLNMYDGINIQVYKPTVNNPNSLSGNLIEGIMEAEDGILWIATNHGFNRLDKRTRMIEYHDEFQGKYHWAKTRNHDVFAIHENDRIDYYDKIRKRFVSVDLKGIVNSEIHNFFIDEKDIMWIVSNAGEVTNLSVSSKNSHFELKVLKGPEHDMKLLYAFQEQDRIYFIDENYNFFELNAASRKKSLVMNLKELILENGIVSSIIRDNDDYLVAFQTNGLIRLRNTPESETKYRPERIDIYCGVFSLCKDELQDIIWIGTDGQGVYMYSRDSFSMRSTVFDDLPYHIQKPVRALLLDKQKDLWVGTKDDGILVIRDYQTDGNINAKNIDHLTTNNSELINNSVYSFSSSRRNILWIGGDGPGLNYYSYRERKIRKVPSKSPEIINYVHSICEVSDSVLWLATVGSGVLKVTLSGTDDHPQIETIKRTMFIRDELSYNYFFSVYQENDSILWFGNRGYGAQRLNIFTETFQPVRFYKKDIETINDVLSIHQDNQKNMWFGSSFGITRLLKQNADSAVYENYSEIEGLPNNTIHGILEDNRGYLWLSTNSGIVQFDEITKNFRIYNHNNGLDVIEFSDGAYFKDEQTGTLFFGGTNGFITISSDIFMEKEFVPRIFFTGLKIYENEYNLADFLKKDKNGEYLELKYEQNFFSISFVALDYINGQNCKYTYNLENFSEKWIENGQSDRVNFTNISPGEYILHVRYKNGTSDLLHDVYSLKIVILPPWYMTTWAYVFYTFLFILVLFFSVQTVRRRYKRKGTEMIERMNQQQKEEIYESKLRFFTNITHELCTPLTLIYGPCARIISYAGADAFVKKYASLILKNTERLNSLIQELIEFRRIETGHKSCEIEELSISELSRGIAESFFELVETKKIDYQVRIENDIRWNSDKGCLTKIITNLLSNAFKYTPDNGKIELLVELVDDCLKIIVSNTGKGIKAEDIPFVFDRYRVLENFEKQTQKGISSRNGLGLAICHNMVKLLQGEIDVKSTPDEYTIFKVSLPSQEINVFEKKELSEDPSFFWMRYENDKSLVEKEDYDYKFLKSRPTILVIDDDPEMLWFVSEIFTNQYNIIPIEDSTTVVSALEKVQPNLIISDIMMPHLDGIALMKAIKKDKRIAHIPFILLSAKNTPEEQVEGIASGAEAYITKPFNVDYLKSVVNRLIQRQDDLKDYYHSALSAFEFADGRYVHIEDKDFFNKVIQVIDKNLMNSDFSTEELASYLGMSVRHLYRKLKNISDQTPSDIIKEYRLAVVQKLLLTTQFSVDEIMYKAGFSNRGSFYRLFSQKFGMTPKNYRLKKKSEVK